MPIYEYVCSKCRHEFEALVRGDEQPECPKCGARKLNKLLSAPVAHMAGSSSAPSCGMDHCPGRGSGGECEFGSCGM